MLTMVISHISPVFLTAFSVGESAISFGMAIFTVIGGVFWIIYGGYGLGTLPVDLLRGKKSIEQTKNEWCIL